MGGTIFTEKFASGAEVRSGDRRTLVHGGVSKGKEVRMDHPIKIIAWPTFEKLPVFAQVQQLLKDNGFELHVRYSAGGELKVFIEDKQSPSP
jgi:hypothetical protein